jgi:MFS family permease
MPAGTDGPRFYGWVNLAIAAVMGIIGGFYIISFSYFLPFWVEEFGWNRGVVSRAATINLIALGVSSPLAGAFIVRHGARRAMVLGNLLGGAGFLLLCFHSRLWELFLGYGLLVGTGAGLGGMLASTTVVNNWFIKRRSLALSLFLAAGGFGGMVLGPAIMQLIGTIGWRATFLVISLMVLLFAVILPACLIRNRPADMNQVPDGLAPDAASPGAAARPMTGYRTAVDFTLGEALRTRSLWLLIAYFCMNMLAVGALMPHQVAYLFDVGLGATLAAAALGVMSGVMAFGQLSVGFLGMRYSMHAIAVSSEILKLAGLCILLVAHSVPMVFLYMTVLGAGFGGVMAATMNMIPNYFGASDYPRIMGCVRLFWTFIGGAGAPLAGLVREASGSYTPAFQGAVVVVVAGLVCLILARPPVHPSLREAAVVEAYSPAPSL